MSLSTRRRNRLPHLVLEVFALSAWCAPTLAQQPKVFAPHRPVPPVLSKPYSPQLPAVSRSLAGGLWMTDGSMKSSIHITNDLVTSSLTVTPVLWLSNGVKYILPAVTMEPSGTTIVDINQALADQGLAPYGTLSGYVELNYIWPWDAICATIINLDVAHSVIFSYGLQIASPVTPVAAAPAQTETQTLEGLWWKQEPNVSGFVAFTNSTSEPVSANLTFSDAFDKPLSQHSVTVSPHGTKMLDLSVLPQSADASGGLRVVYGGAPNDLLVSGGLRDNALGYSANMFFAPSPAATPKASKVSYAELGLMTGIADPMLNFPVGTVFTPYSIIRNISDQPIVVTPKIWWMANSVARSAILPHLSLVSHQTVKLDMSSLLAQTGLKNYNGSVNLVLDVDASVPRGSVLLASGSVDQKNTYVFQVVPESVRESIAKNLSYWSTVNGDDTMVTIWNPTDEAQDFLFTLFYTGGHYKHPLHLEPRASSMFNISEILHSAIPDAEGNTIPAGIHEGSAELSGSQGEAQRILVAMDAGNYNVQKATCTNVCKTCQGAVNSFIVDNPFVVPVSGTHNLTFTVQNHSGTQVNDTAGASWSSSNPSVATVSAGLVRGVAAGTLQAVSNDDTYPVYATACFPQGVTIDCPISEGVNAPSPGTVTPKIMFGGSGGTDITNKTQNVVVGQQIVLYASYTLPSGVSVNSQSWSVPGTTVGGFNTAPINGGPAATDFIQRSTTFYWVVAGNPQTVTLTLNLSDNSHPTATATFNVSGPTSVSATVTVQTAPSAFEIVSSQLTFGIVLGTPGMKVTAVANAPTGGQFEWAQIITADSETTTVGSITTPCSMPTGLDNVFPTDTGLSDADSPASTLKASWNKMTATGGFQTFLMWDPKLTGSIPVPLGNFTWRFFGDAVQNMTTHVWTVQSDSSGGSTPFQLSSAFPTWSNTVVNGKQTCN